MKLKVAHFDEQVFKDKLQHLSHLDFSLFIDSIPKSQEDLSPINIIFFQEPNEYFGIHDWVIKNKDVFNIILTQSDKVLNNCENAVFSIWGNTWIVPEMYNKNHTKEFKLAHLQGKLLKTYGHSLRHEVTARENEFSIPTKFYETYGDRNNIEDARLGKEFIFGDSQFGVVIEKNWKLALEYVNFEQRLVDTITEIFKHNKLI